MRIGYFGDGPWAHNALEILNNKMILRFFLCAVDLKIQIKF